MVKKSCYNLGFVALYAHRNLSFGWIWFNKFWTECSPSFFLSSHPPLLLTNQIWSLILLSLCTIRNSQYYEKVSDPLDLSTIEKQILTGHYKTVEAFDTDMLKVFRNAEVGKGPVHMFVVEEIRILFISNDQKLFK